MSAQSHVRIDEGIARGPRKKRTSPTLKIEPKPMLQGKLATADLDQILTRYLSDETTAQIAQDLQVHRSALHQWLLRHAEEPWKQAQVARAITALDQAKDDLASAEDALSLARAREQLRGAQWELERLYSRVFGQHIQVKNEVVISGENLELATAARDLLALFKEKVVNHEPEALTSKSLIDKP